MCLLTWYGQTCCNVHADFLASKFSNGCLVKRPCESPPNWLLVNWLPLCMEIYVFIGSVVLYTWLTHRQQQVSPKALSVCMIALLINSISSDHHFTHCFCMFVVYVLCTDTWKCLVTGFFFVLSAILLGSMSRCTSIVHCWAGIRCHLFTCSAGWCRAASHRESLPRPPA